MGYSSLYTGVTGLKAYGDNMQVIGNNLANVNTVGYKRSVAQFSDLMSVNAGCSGIGYESGDVYSPQVGKGVRIAAVLANFEQGSLQTTTTTTDLAIEGRGFFGVRNALDDSSHYTRAGEFRFNRDAYLVDPHGLRLQGHAVDRETGEVQAAVSDILLPYEEVENAAGETVRVIQSPPRATENATIVANLDEQNGDKFVSSNSPLTAMFNAWNTTSGAAFGSGNSASMNVYDSEGNKHVVTIHYDPVNKSSLSGADGGAYWEYIVTIDPDEDGRASVQGTSTAGLLAMGVLHFDTSGKLDGQSMYTMEGGAADKVLSNWGLATLSEDGAPQLSVTFAGSGAGTAQTIDLDFGLTSETASWENVGSNASAADLGTNVYGMTTLADGQRGTSVTTAYPGHGNATMFSTQDGYSTGYLQGMSVDSEGFLVGQFSNGESERLYQVSMYMFTNDFGLRREGSNLFGANDESGVALEGTAGQGGRGTISQNSLEVSNVDMADEFAHMILTQRAFQANTKVVTTSDHLMNVALQTKR
ncbi:flagellar hook protein FlgE [Pseudodesulfovibrio senegalensis]|uniref:Flagellar hook protein FlgE n=1 Tax=Pseudodesulfovibrio senegalensis TaxID=1721087 RepID=A0A6N6N3M6_9BACT|nr:flagellar hook-basal body complex protein [Pseudodesulfovibrio senegalensis]KAB1441683.1 flagellar hook-basal body complex protein [Pseudodesulfovibrio senegalensis]